LYAQSDRAACYQAVPPNSSVCSKQSYTWAQGQAACAAQNTRLVSIHNAGENAFVSNLTANASAIAEYLRNYRPRKSECSRKPKQLHCRPLNIYYWIGLQFTRDTAGAITGAAWEDDTPVNYGNPLGSGPLQPPYATGHPPCSVLSYFRVLASVLVSSSIRTSLTRAYREATRVRWMDGWIEDGQARAGEHQRTVVYSCNSISYTQFMPLLEHPFSSAD